MELLQNINSPKELKDLKQTQLPQLCAELREFIINELANNPGHLGSSLGVIELTVAIHYCYDIPFDNLVWDVGHQAYAHKLLTGRRDLFSTNRRYGGISGFPKRSESKYDSFGGGHSSVSISAALGMDIASKLQNKDNYNIAVIGDGAMSGGLAFEGLNNAGFSADNLLVILNDNDMSIDPNVGALNEYLLKITTSRGYNKFKQKAIKILSSVPILSKVIANIAEGVKNSLLRSNNLFNAFGFRYFGVVDGHNIDSLIEVLGDLKRIKGPKLLHVVTKKGKGYAPAESSQIKWHAPGKYIPQTGELVGKSSTLMKFQDVFGITLLELASENPKIIGVTPAMPSGCSMVIMQNEFPERVFDVGIAEGHAVTFSAGAAASGLLPFCNIYSSFMQRAYDNVIHDVVLQNVDVVLCLDRSGLVGEDGVTHHGIYDIAYFRTVPNIIISAPSNEHELRNIMYKASKGGLGAIVIRYPRGEGSIEKWHNEPEDIEIGKSKRLKQGEDIAVLTLGTTSVDASIAIEEVEKEYNCNIEHIDLRFAKPLDTAMLDDIAKRFNTILTIEDGSLNGGVGSAILEYLSDKESNINVKRLGVPDIFIEHGKISQLKAQCGYDKDGIKTKIIECLKIKQ